MFEVFAIQAGTAVEAAAIAEGIGLRHDVRTAAVGTEAVVGSATFDAMLAESPDEDYAATAECECDSPWAVYAAGDEYPVRSLIGLDAWNLIGLLGLVVD